MAITPKAVTVGHPRRSGADTRSALATEDAVAAKILLTRSDVTPECTRTQGPQIHQKGSRCRGVGEQRPAGRPAPGRHRRAGVDEPPTSYLWPPKHRVPPIRRPAHRIDDRRSLRIEQTFPDFSQSRLEATTRPCRAGRPRAVRAPARASFSGRSTISRARRPASQAPQDEVRFASRRSASRCCRPAQNRPAWSAP